MCISLVNFKASKDYFYFFSSLLTAPITPYPFSYFSYIYVYIYIYLIKRE